MRTVVNHVAPMSASAEDGLDVVESPELAENQAHGALDVDDVSMMLRELRLIEALRSAAR